MSCKSQSPNCAIALREPDYKLRLWCSKFRAVAISSLLLVVAARSHAELRATNEQKKAVTPAESAVPCMPEGAGFLKARISGAIKSELNWTNATTECTGAARPNGGVRLRFSHDFGEAGKRLVLVFGIPTLDEAKDAHNVPVNVTIIREGAGEFFGTRGDDKCTIENLTQTAIAALPRKTRTYRVIASGFCTQPARAITGTGAVMIVRFDFAGRVDFASEDRDDDRALAQSH